MSTAFAVNNLLGDVIYQESGGMVVGEAEYYSRRTFQGGTVSNSWYVVLDESAGNGTFTNARNNAFIQSLPDNGSAGSPTNPPSISCQMEIYTPGTYRLYLRWDANMSINGGGNSDSLFVDIEEDTDGLLSLVLFRTLDNPATDQFASKESTTYLPPRLDVVYGIPVDGTIIRIQ